MNITNCKLKGVKIIDPIVHGDDRGDFKEVFKFYLLFSLFVNSLYRSLFQVTFSKVPRLSLIFVDLNLVQWISPHNNKVNHGNS